MQAELNGFLLNEVANGILFLIAVVVFVNTLLDRRINGAKRDRDFSLFVLCCAIYIGLMLIWLPIRDFGAEFDPALGFALSILRVFTAMLAYGFFANWLVSLTPASEHAQQRIGRMASILVVAIFLVSLVLRVVTGDAVIANIPISLYYLLLVVLAIRFRSSIGVGYAAILVGFIIVELLLQMQTWWDYTPANIFLVLGVMMIYSRLWLVKKEERIERERLLAEQRADLENARTKLVLSQIKPHFLFNTLSTIAYLCTKQPEMARDLCVDFASYLRSNLSALDSGVVVNVEKELEHVKAYLKIEQVRFGDILTVAYDIEDVDFGLPALTIEPLVENAVKHGIRKRSGGGTVLVATGEEPGFHVVTVKDDGAGFDVEAVEKAGGDHVGIRSVRQRIELLSRGTLTVESVIGAGTTATIRIPKA